jgi:outer membrane protein insertion porin family
MYIIKKLKSIKIFLFIFCIIFSQTTAFPQSTKSYKILGISVVGNKTADITTIIANSGLKVGDEIQIPGDQTINAIKQLWSLNIFSDAQVLIEKEMPDGIFIQIKVEEYRRLE